MALNEERERRIEFKRTGIVITYNDPLYGEFNTTMDKYFYQPLMDRCKKK